MVNSTKTKTTSFIASKKKQVAKLVADHLKRCGGDMAEHSQLVEYAELFVAMEYVLLSPKEITELLDKQEHFSELYLFTIRREHEVLRQELSEIGSSKRKKELLAIGYSAEFSIYKNETSVYAAPNQEKGFQRLT